MDEKVFYDYCYYSVGVVVAAKKSWFHLGLPQGSWLAYYCPPWLSTLSCFLPLLLLLLPRKGKLKKGKREAIEVLEAAKVNVVSVKEFAAKSHVSGRQIWINFDLDFMLILERNAVILRPFLNICQSRVIEVKGHSRMNFEIMTSKKKTDANFGNVR